MELPLISVIIPVYNVEKYLQEAIESVIYQFYGNWELILVDNGSTDASLEICKKYSNQDIRIKSITANRKGACYARNCGLLSAEGEYIFFMDADDVLTSDCLQYLLDTILKENVDIVSGSSKSFKDNQSYTSCNLHSNDKTDSVTMLNDVLTGRTICSIWGKLYKKEAISNVFFANELKIAQDVNFLARLFLTKPDLKIYRSSNVIYKYRIVNDSISHSKKDISIKIKSYIDEMVLLYKEYKDNISRMCASSFAKNLYGTIFVYLRTQSFMNKYIDPHIIRSIHDLDPVTDYPHYKKPIEILRSESRTKINIYFSYDEIRTAIKRIKSRCTSSINRLLRTH